MISLGSQLAVASLNAPGVTRDPGVSSSAPQKSVNPDKDQTFKQSIKKAQAEPSRRQAGNN